MFHHCLNQRMTQTFYGGYAPCGSALVITLLQKYRFPLSRATPPQNWHTQSTHTHIQCTCSGKLFTLRTSRVSHPHTIHKHTLSSFSLHSFALSPFFFFAPHYLLVALFLHSIGWNIAVRCRTTKFTSSIEHEISSTPPCLCQSPWGRPWVGVSASWLSPIQDREGRLICIADSCATIGYILPNPETQKN